MPKELAPQQLGWNICPLKFQPGTVRAQLSGYRNPKRGSDWRAGFVGVGVEGKPTYGEVFGPEKPQSFEVKDGIKELYLVVLHTPTNILNINMTGDFRSFEQEQFPYRVKFQGCQPLDVMMPEKPTVAGKPHPNGGGFVAETAKVDESVYVDPQAQVLGNSKISGQVRIEDFACVVDSTVADEAVVSGHALVERAVMHGRAKARDFACVKGILEGDAKVLEHAETTVAAKDGVVIKGVACNLGKISGNAMIDGFYCKSNPITKGKWFTWSWGQGKNPGEVNEEFDGLYADFDFELPHAWMASDAFGATWGYLVGSPTIADGMLTLNGKDQFVELPKDVADFRQCMYTAWFKWEGGSGARVFEFANPNGDAVWLSPSEGGKLLLAVRHGAAVQEVAAAPARKGVATKVQVVFDGHRALLVIDGKVAATNENMDFTPEIVYVTQCYLGRGLKGDYFAGQIDRFTIHQPSLGQKAPAAPVEHLDAIR